MDVTHDGNLADNVEIVLRQVGENLTHSLSLEPENVGPLDHFRVAALNVAAAGFLELIDCGDDSESEMLDFLGIDRTDPRPVSGCSEPDEDVCPIQALLLATLSVRKVFNELWEHNSRQDLRSVVCTALKLVAARLGVVIADPMERDDECDWTDELNQACLAFNLLVGHEPKLGEDLPLIADLVPLRYEMVRRPSVVHDIENGHGHSRDCDPEATPALARWLELRYDWSLEEDQADDRDEPYEDGETTDPRNQLRTIAAEYDETARKAKAWFNEITAAEWFREWHFDVYCQLPVPTSESEETWPAYVHLCQWISDRVHRSEVAHETVKDLLEVIDTDGLGYSFSCQIRTEFAELLRLKHPDPDSSEAHVAARIFQGSDDLYCWSHEIQYEFELLSVEQVLRVARDLGSSDSGDVPSS